MSTTSIEQPQALLMVPMGSGPGTEYDTADGATVLTVVSEVAVGRSQRGTSVYLTDVLGGGEGAGVTISGTGQDRFVQLMVGLVAKAVSA